MATTTNLGKVHVFPSEESYNTNKSSVGTNDLALVPIGVATTSEYGLVRFASESDVLTESEDATMNVPLAYELNDFRRIDKAYSVGDKVNCAFKFEYYLECTTAGTTSAETLDTRNVTHGQVITDGTCQWTVRTHVKSINGDVPDANGNIEIDVDMTGYALEQDILDACNEAIKNYKEVGEVDLATVLSALAELQTQVQAYQTELNLIKSYDYVIETGSNEDDGRWYRKYKSGWIEQGGRITVGVDSSKIITLLKEMADTNYYANWISCDNVSTTGSGTRAARTLTTTTFSVNNGQDTSMTANWFVCGKAKE